MVELDREGAGTVVVAHGEGGGALVGARAWRQAARGGVRPTECPLRDPEVRDDRDTWGPPARERERGGERVVGWADCWARKGREGRFSFFLL